MDTIRPHQIDTNGFCSVSNLVLNISNFYFYCGGVSDRRTW